jgi:curli biogenesis system outer membrane secretion channel CsgG
MDCVKTLIITFLLALSACTGVLAQQEQPQKKPVIGIKTFENPPNYANSTIGNGLTVFITELAKTNKYQIVEREALKELIQEVELGQSTYGAKGSAVPKGRFKGMEYLFIAKVTNFGEKQKNIGGGGIGVKILGGVVGRRSEAYVRIDFRIVDATTGEIVYVGSGDPQRTCPLSPLRPLRPLRLFFIRRKGWSDEPIATVEGGGRMSAAAVHLLLL